MKELIAKIKQMSDETGILYVEDNKGLRENVTKLLHQICPIVHSAENGMEAYKLFVKYEPKIVITDLRMPELNGYGLIKKVIDYNSTIKIIILTAFDDKENLFNAINLGVFRYLTKPAKVPELVGVIYEALNAIHKYNEKCIFESQLNDIFNYQNNLLLMIKDDEPVLANRQFFNFFGVNDLSEFQQQYSDIKLLLAEHKGFLYSTEQSCWLDEAIKNAGKLFHTKVKNNSDEYKHLILKLRTIPRKPSYFILSFDDITDLNLMTIFDNDRALEDKKESNKKSIFKLINVIKENNGEVKIYNLYRGLTIVAKGVIVSIDHDTITVKTTYTQIKAVDLFKSMTLNSELFPHSIICSSIKNINFDELTLTFSKVNFVETSIDQRSFIRLEPDCDKHTVTMFYRDVKFFGQTKIIDISIRSVKVEIDALPAGMIKGEEVRFAIVLETSKGPMNFIVSGEVYRLDTLSRGFHIVILFELNDTIGDKLLHYLSQRQIDLIREFKDL